MAESSYYPVRTKGNIIVNDIQIGDIHYEFDYGFCVRSQVISKPVRDSEGRWTWQSKHLKTGNIIDYMVTEGFEHYSPNLYDYQAYIGAKYE